MIPDQTLQPDANLGGVPPQGPAPNPTDDMQCMYCGAPITGASTVINGGKGAYCSMDCMGNNEYPNGAVGAAQRANDEVVP